MPNQATGIAYQQVGPIQTDFYQITRDIKGDIDERERQRQLEEEKKLLRKQANDKAIQDRKNELAEQFGTDYKEISEVMTNTKSIDEALSLGVISARDSLGNLYKELEQNPTRWGDSDWQIKRANLTNFSKNLATASTNLTEYTQSLITSMADGTGSEWNRNDLNSLDSIYGKANLTIGVDKEGMPIISMLKLDNNGNVIDKDGNPTDNAEEAVPEVISIHELMDGRFTKRKVNKYEFDTQVQKLGKDLGDRVKASIQDGFVVTTQDFESIEQDLRNTVRGIIGTPQNPTDVAKSVWSDWMGLAPTPDGKLDEGDMKAIEDHYVESVKPFYDEREKKTKVPTTTDDKPSEIKNRRQIKLKTDSATNKPRVEKVGDTSSYIFTVPRDKKGIGPRIGNMEVTDIRLAVNDKTGEEKVLFSYNKEESSETVSTSVSGPAEREEATERERKKALLIGDKAGTERTSTSQRKKITSTGTSDDATELASVLGFNDVEELKNYLKGLAPQQTTPKGQAEGDSIFN